MPRRAAVDDKEKTPQADDDARHKSALVLSGPEMLTLPDEQWDDVLKVRSAHAPLCTPFARPDSRLLAQFDEAVFARTTPQQKLQIVKRFQAAGETVAVTGDGGASSLLAPRFVSSATSPSPFTQTDEHSRVRPQSTTVLRSSKPMSESRSLAGPRSPWRVRLLPLFNVPAGDVG